jgi:hypothetical protein
VIALLTSGATLGTHVPALILAERLRRAGQQVQVHVFEELLPSAEVERLRAAKTAFRGTFRMAVAAQRMVRDQAPALDDNRVTALLERWRTERVSTVVAFSGFWVPVVERYRAAAAGAVRADICHLDAAATPSFRLFEDTTADYRHIWMFDAEHDTIPASIPVTDEEPLPWSARDRRVFAHGGGWGLGTYRDRAAEIAGHGIGVDVVAHDRADCVAAGGRLRYYLVDPGWEAWMDGGYPPFGRLAEDGSVDYRRGLTHHASFDVVRRSLAMLCKTGGGTLIDSLWSATPIVALEPFGEHEQINALLWERLGFGMGYDAWRSSGFSLDLLEKAHLNLLRARDGVADYTADLAGSARAEAISDAG